ncbi:hypothetical protein [Streptosporangium sp. NPDC001681]|uniref:hypothetical protein n=1 Tax=Streptosporangium sp. NPDC001681 TaxID=3154395 RepID=UPI003325BB82
MSAVIEYDPMRGDRGNLRLLVDGRLVEKGIYHNLPEREAGAWELTITDPDGKPIDEYRGSRYTAPMSVLRERLREVHGVASDDITERSTANHSM